MPLISMVRCILFHAGDSNLIGNYIIFGKMFYFLMYEFHQSSILNYFSFVFVNDNHLVSILSRSSNSV